MNADLIRSYTAQHRVTIRRDPLYAEGEWGAWEAEICRTDVRGRRVVYGLTREHVFATARETVAAPLVAQPVDEVTDL